MRDYLKKLRREILVCVTLSLLLFTVGCSKSTTVDNSSKDNTSEVVDIQSEDSTVNYLCFTAQEAGSTIVLDKYGEVPWAGSTSTDGRIWDAYILGTKLFLDDIGDKVYFKGTLSEGLDLSAYDYSGSTEDVSYLNFTMTGKISASGNLNSLHYENDFETRTELDYEFEYFKLFDNCVSLTTAPELPATRLAKNCYRSMFSDCVALTTAPELPATRLADCCYALMFLNCDKLTTAPELPATTLAIGCYGWMFNNCNSLIAAPELPATTLAKSCYYAMFSSCRNLITIPKILPATVLTEWCYYAMFSGCDSITTAPELPATTLADYCYTDMFNYCIGLTTLPKLYINSLADYCCSGMFFGCKKIKLSTTLTDEYNIEYEITSSDVASEPYMFENMFYETGGTFTGTPDINTTYYMAKQ